MQTENSVSRLTGLPSDAEKLSGVMDDYNSVMTHEGNWSRSHMEVPFTHDRHIHRWRSCSYVEDLFIPKDTVQTLKIPFTCGGPIHKMRSHLHMEDPFTGVNPFQTWRSHSHEDLSGQGDEAKTQ